MKLLKRKSAGRVWKVAAAGILAAVLILSCGGCGMGLLYTRRIEPYDTNMTKTPISLQARVGDLKQLQYSLVDVRWDSNAIGDIAKAGGIETVYFADVETFSLLLGIWRQRTLIIYGL